MTTSSPSAVGAAAPSDVAVAPPVPVGRRAVLYAVRRHGDASVEDVAADVGITASGARQHLSSLVEHGLVEAVEDRGGPPRRGRPRLTYHVTDLGDLLFPKSYGALTNELLGYIAESGEEAVERLFDRRRDHRIAQASARLDRQHSLAAKIAELTAMLDEDGYLATSEQVNRDHFRILEHNCAIAAVAATYRQACRSELEFISAVLPGAEVSRVTHLVSGDRCCGYEISRRRRPA